MPPRPADPLHQVAEQVIRDALNGPLNDAVADAKLPAYIKDRLAEYIEIALRRHEQAVVERCARVAEAYPRNPRMQLSTYSAWTHDPRTLADDIAQAIRGTAEGKG